MFDFGKYVLIKKCEPFFIHNKYVLGDYFDITGNMALG